MQRHIMLDLETMGKKPGCAILSIGAVEFDPRCALPHTRMNQFYQNIDLTDCVSNGLVIDLETQMWSQTQSKEACESLLTNQVSLRTACIEFSNWLRVDDETRIWCQGASSDAPILQWAYELLGLTTPWKFWMVRDTRTIYDVKNYTPDPAKRPGTHHNALDDAIYQAFCVAEALTL